MSNIAVYGSRKYFTCAFRRNRFIKMGSCRSVFQLTTNDIINQHCSLNFANKHSWCRYFVTICTKPSFGRCEYDRSTLSTTKKNQEVVKTIRQFWKTLNFRLFHFLVQKTNQVRCPEKYACDNRLHCAKLNVTVKETVIEFALLYVPQTLSKVWLVLIH